VQGEYDQPLVLDEVGERLERFAALGDTHSAAADAVLDELGATGRCGPPRGAASRSGG
jgi:hypothetical protein